MKKWSFSTSAIHAGETGEKIEGAVTLPIFQSSTYLYEGQSSYGELKYLRLNNTPNHISLCRKIAALEEGEAAIVTASGMAAVSDSLMAVLQQGDHMLAQNCIYGGSRDLLSREFPRHGIEVDFVESLARKDLEAGMQANTRALLVESITNPLMQIDDLVQAAEFAREKGIVCLIDNTFPSPFNFQPLKIGYDMVIHSCSKYLNGHTDLVAGAVIGSREMIEKVNHRNIHFGATLDPHTCFLLNRGIKTLPLRMRQHNSNAAALAEFFARHPKIARVHYPGLPGSGVNARTRKLFNGFGGMLSIELKGGKKENEGLIRGLQIPANAPSLGGVESLITIPARTSHAGLSPEERKSTGISDNLVRISVGIEGVEDLLEDFEQALQQIG